MSNKNIFKFAVLSMLVFLGIFISFNLCKANLAQGNLVINEIVARTTDGSNDWIELYVVGNDPVYLGDHSLVDDAEGRVPAPLPGIALGPGEFIVIQATDEDPNDGSYYVPFRLGADDSVTLYWGINIVDVLDWEDGDAPAGYSYGRLPDGTGEAQTLAPTPNAMNEAPLTSSLIINEILARDPNGGNDWIELYVNGNDSVYLGDYSIVDDNIEREPITLPDTTLYPEEFIVILATYEEPEDGSYYVPFRLGSDDCVTLYFGTDIVDILDWVEGDAPSGVSYGLLPDGTGDAQSMIPTPGAPNSGFFGYPTVFPSFATQADMNVALTITLSQDMAAILPPDIIPLSVKIGQLEGSNITRNGLQITAVFDIPANEPTGMKDVSVSLPPPPMDPNAQPMSFTKTDTFEIIRGYLPFTIGPTTTDDIFTDIPTFTPGGLYEETILRTIYLEFTQEDWWQQLEANYGTEVNILADLTMEGNTYHDVGVRFRGTTSYMMTGNSQKKPFNIEIDETYPDQRLMGYKTLNLNNANRDPSFIREVLYFNIFRRYAPCPQANFVKLVINGEDWGIYVNVQQQNSDLIEEWFEDNDGDRWKVGMRGGQGGFIPFQSLADWLVGPTAEDLNNDGQINEIDFDIYIQSQMPPGGGWGDPNMRPPGGGMFDPNFIPMQPTLQEWLASPMARDMNSDGQINEEDYTIFINSQPMPPGGGWGDPNMMPPGGGMMFGGGNGALTWLGSDVAAYEQAYELKSEHTPDPWANLIAACDVLNNTPLDQLAEVADSVLAVDRWLWFVTMENIFTDEDSYLTKGWDYQIYYDPKTGQIRPLQHDGNETFVNRFVNQSPFAGEDAASRPVISRLMAVPQFRERYLAHIRTIIEESLDWDVLAPQIEAYRVLIADEVQVDTKKLYSYDQFEASFLDIQNFINGRRNYLLSHPEINRPAPEISSVVRQVTLTDSSSVLPGQPVWIISTVQVGSDIEQGILYYTTGKSPFEQVSMFFADVNGNPDDVEILVGEIPPFPPGSMIRYYVEVRATDTSEGNSFEPYNAENYIFTYRVLMPIADSTPIVINELMARNQLTIQDPQGDYDDWIELLNISDQEIDLSGMYLSDNEDNPLKWEIPEGTTLAPGAYLIIWADEDGGDEPGLHANFKLSASGEMILLVDTDERGNAILDSVIFGEQEADISFGRYPNGTGEFVVLSVPTPNEENYLDNDGDGYTPDEGDCDDDNPAINPGAIEVYDEVDNNCDGLVDEEIAVIAKVFPSSGKKGDDVTLTITLIEEMTLFLPEMDLLSVKIGSLEGSNININGLKIAAIFDIPANKTKGMYDVSVEFQRSNGQTIIFTKSDAFEVRAGNTDTPGKHYGWYIGNHYGWFNPVTSYMPQSWYAPQSVFGFRQQSWSSLQNVFGFGQQNWLMPQNAFGFGEQNWYGLKNQGGYQFGMQGWNDFITNNWFGYSNQPGFGGLFQNRFGYPFRTGLGFFEFEDWFKRF
jgi:hypothetical protein